MIKTDNEPNKESNMDDSSDSLEKKLELDKLQVQLKKKKPIAPPIAPQPADEPEPETPSESHPQRRSIPKAAIVGGASLVILSLFAALFFLWKSGMLFPSPEELPESSDPYADIGPVTIPFGGPEETFSISLKVHFTKPELRKEIAQKEELIKNKLVSFLSSDAGKEIIRRRDFNSLRSLLMDEINHTLTGNAVDEVYFSELQ